MDKILLYLSCPDPAALGFQFQHLCKAALRAPAKSLSRWKAERTRNCGTRFRHRPALEAAVTSTTLAPRWSPDLSTSTLLSAPPRLATLAALATVLYYVCSLQQYSVVCTECSLISLNVSPTGVARGSVSSTSEDREPCESAHTEYKNPQKRSR